MGRQVFCVWGMKKRTNLLQVYGIICDRIAELCRAHVEVVLHDLATETMSSIANSDSKLRPAEPPHVLFSEDWRYQNNRG
jgi:predicted transcriptional regulator YheO